MFNGRSKVLFVGTLLATLYVVIVFLLYKDSIESIDSINDIWIILAGAIVIPHLYLIGLGALFGWISFFLRNHWIALVGAILYCVGAVLFLLYIIFTIPLIVLGFVGFAKQKKLAKNI